MRSIRNALAAISCDRSSASWILRQRFSAKPNMGFRYSAMIFSVSVLFICFLALSLSKAFTYIDAEILKGLECMKKILLWGILLLYHAFFGWQGGSWSIVFKHYFIIFSTKRGYMFYAVGQAWIILTINGQCVIINWEKRIESCRHMYVHVNKNLSLSERSYAAAFSCFLRRSRGSWINWRIRSAWRLIPCLNRSKIQRHFDVSMLMRITQ